MREAIFAELRAIADAITLSPDQLWCSRDAGAACSSQNAQQPPRVSKGKKNHFSLYNCYMLRNYLILARATGKINFKS
jgi:hypothetical protein